MKTDTSSMVACKGSSKQLPNQSAITGTTPPRSEKPGALPAGVAMHMAPVGEGTNQHQQSIKGSRPAGTDTGTIGVPSRCEKIQAQSSPLPHGVHQRATATDIRSDL